MTYYPPRSTILQNFSPIAQTVYEIMRYQSFSLLALIFDPQGHLRSNLTVAVGPTYKCSLEPKLVSVIVFEILGVKILTLTF